MPRISLFLAAATVWVVLPVAALAQQAIPTISGAATSGDNTAARERAASSAIEQQVEYRTNLQRDLAVREQMLRTSEKDLEARKQRLRNTHQELLLTAQKVQEQAAKLKEAEATAAEPNASDAPAADGTSPTAPADSVDPSVVKRLSKDLEVQSYEIQVASAQIKRLQQDVDYLRGVIAQMSGGRR